MVFRPRAGCAGIAMELFTQLFGDLLAFVYQCFDRIVIYGYLSALSRPELRLPRFSGRFVSLQSTSWSWRPACRLRRLSVSGIPGPNATAPDYTNPRCS